MFTPTQLYNEYSTNICEGTPYNLPRLVQFVKHLDRPCYNPITIGTNVPPALTGNIGGTGANKLGLPFKFLMRLDAEAFTEIQPSVRSGTSHGIRNACDITRACDIEVSGNYEDWEARMATEYLEYFAGNSLPDCLMMLGPDLVSGVSLDNNGDPILNNLGRFDYSEIERTIGCNTELSCFLTPVPGSVGAPHSCQFNIFTGRSVCDSCSPCTVDPESPSYYTDPCCPPASCMDRMNKCCGQPRTTRFDFEYLIPSDDNSFGGNTLTGWIDQVFKHIGIIKRKRYDGYANFLDPTIASNLNVARNDIFLKYFQKSNDYDYVRNTGLSNNFVPRMRTISFIQQNQTSSVKDLLYNGYGVVLFTNVGFPNTRDSTGLGYPDRNHYHTYSIIGYDDRKLEYPECVFLISNSWGNWNTGGGPSWGPIPEGSFLVTETHLNKMVKFNQNPDLIGCREKPCPEPCDPLTKLMSAACTEDSSCVPFACTDYQSAFGLIIGLSTHSGFPPRNLDYQQFYPVNKLRTQEDASILYFN